MTINHRFVLRIATNTAITILVLFTIGLLLFIIDEALRWDVLPDWIGKYAETIIGVAGTFAGLCVAAILMVGFSLIAESRAKEADLPDFKTPKSFKRVVVYVLIGFVVIVSSLQIVDVYRKKAQKEERRQERVADFEKSKAHFELMQKTLENALPDILHRFPTPLIQGLKEGSLSGTPQSKDLKNLLQAIQVSTPYSPQVSLLLPASDPYRYAKLDLNHLHLNDDRHYEIDPEFYIDFPDPREAELIQNLFNRTAKPINQVLRGKALYNTSPGTWGCLEWEGNIVAILILQTATGDYTDPITKELLIHTGPDTFRSNMTP